MVPNEVSKAVELLLESLGTTPAEVAANLEAKAIQGVRNTTRREFPNLEMKVV